MAHPKAPDLSSAASPRPRSLRLEAFTQDAADIERDRLLFDEEVDAAAAREKGPSPFNAEVLAILVVYFVQGALGLARLAVTFFLKDEFHLDPAGIAAVSGICTLPWVIKPVYGFFSDSVPIFGYKRRSYLIIAGLVGCLSWISLGTVIDTLPMIVASNVVGSMSIAVSDVVVDSIVVERSRDTRNALRGGDLQSLCWGSSAVGGLISAYFSGSLLEVVQPRTIFLFTALFPLLISLAAFFIQESKIARGPAQDLTTVFKAQFGQIKSALVNPKIYLPVLFVFLWQATPSADSALFFYQTNELGFKPEFLGSVRLAASIASLSGILLFRTYLKNLKPKTVIFWASLLSVPLALTQTLLTTHFNRELGIPDKAFALTDTVVLTVLGQVAFMPTLVLAASLCPPGVEGTVRLHSAVHSTAYLACLRSYLLRSCRSTMQRGA